MNEKIRRKSGNVKEKLKGDEKEFEFDGEKSELAWINKISFKKSEIVNWVTE